MKAYMNPYLAGFLLGLVLMASYLIAGRGRRETDTWKASACSYHY